MNADNALKTKSHQRITSTYRVKIPQKTQSKLWIMAGRRCSFPGCNKLLDISQLTLSQINHSNIAHIVPVQKNWPRGDYPLPAEMINDLSNLMLVCMECHKVIDDPKLVYLYPVDILRQYKKEHEERIEYLNGLSASYKTFVIRCRAKILDEEVQIPFDHITEAVLPLYPQDLQGIEIDLTKTAGEDTSAYWTSKKSEIGRLVEKTLSQGIATSEIKHLSLFAIGPIPLLAHLGNCLSNKISTDLFQRHRDNERWTWKEGPPSEYTVRQHRIGTTSENVAILLSLSGTIHFADLPAAIDEKFSLYEITLSTGMPAPTFLNTKKCLQNFKGIYRALISRIMTEHSGLKTVHLFPAVPAPVAVLCGRELLHKVDPVLAVYDFNKNRGGFQFATEINNHG